MQAIRFTPEDLERIDRAAAAVGVSRYEYIQRAAAERAASEAE
jgi:uncharacterized protein (DUF1778 family)